MEVRTGGQSAVPRPCRGRPQRYAARRERWSHSHTRVPVRVCLRVCTGVAVVVGVLARVRQRVMSR